VTVSRGRPLSLLAPERFLSEAGSRDLLARAMKLSSGGGDAQISIRSRWTGNIRWARNEITTAGDTTVHSVNITRFVRGATGSASTNRVDDDSLRDCIQRAELIAQYRNPDPDAPPLRHAERYLKTDLWSEPTFNMDAAIRAEVQQRAVAPAVAAGLLSAGYLEIVATGNGVMNSSGLFAYLPQTRAEFSVTVRNPKGTGSGWAGTENKAWQAIDAAKISARAMDKCTRSADPVAIEPGRYTVILEPQAVFELMLQLVRSLQRIPAEAGQGPWADRSATVAEATTVLPEDSSLLGRSGAQRDVPSRIGQRVLDERITVSADPGDPEMPFVPFAYDSLPYRAVKWIEDGVLKELAYPRQYALTSLNKVDPLNNSGAFRMSGGATSIDQMVADTERGLLITRFSNVRPIVSESLLCSGITSDGVWLIERGKITKAVKNFRFRESPLFAFNNLVSLGVPERVLADMPAICPPAKVRDFSLTSLADAV
jgi:predicted Zn-dependent protease